MISIFDQRLYPFYLKAEKALLRCEPVAFSDSHFRVNSESEEGVFYDLHVVSSASLGDCVVCSCRAGREGNPCKHAALAAADFSETVRLSFAHARAEELYRERLSVLDGTIKKQRLATYIRTYEKSLERRGVLDLLEYVRAKRARIEAEVAQPAAV